MIDKFQHHLILQCCGVAFRAQRMIDKFQHHLAQTEEHTLQRALEWLPSVRYRQVCASMRPTPIRTGRRRHRDRRAILVP